MAQRFLTFYSLFSTYTTLLQYLFCSWTEITRFTLTHAHYPPPRLFCSTWYMNKLTNHTIIQRGTVDRFSWLHHHTLWSFLMRRFNWWPLWKICLKYFCCKHRHYYISFKPIAAPDLVLFLWYMMNYFALRKYRPSLFAPHHCSWPHVYSIFIQDYHKTHYSSK